MRDEEKIRKNKATFLIYWFCATDANLLKKVLKEGKPPLVKLGIPERYITKKALDAVKRQEFLFGAFSDFTAKECHPEPCADLSRSELQKEVSGCVYRSQLQRKPARSKAK